MGATTRKGIFETNSSSSHSITIKVGEEWDNIIPDEDGIIDLFGGEFGWQWEKFNDALTKANYCAVTYQNHDIRIDLLKEVICDYTGAKEVCLQFSTGWDCSYVDHGGWGECEEAFNSYETLRNFIFNKSSWVFLGNDNSCAPNKFYDDPNEQYTKVKF